MNRRYGFAIAAGLALALAARSGSAQAECPPAAIDTCLIGTWQQTGGGAAEWMRQNLKMAVTSVAATNGSLTFNGDGTFSTSKVDTNAEVGAKDLSMHATGQMSAQASGKWSAAGGTLMLCATRTDSKGTIEIEGPGGTKIRVPMPQMKPTETSMSYSCAGNTLSTTQQMPNNTSMTTSYARVP